MYAISAVPNATMSSRHKSPLCAHLSPGKKFDTANYGTKFQTKQRNSEYSQPHSLIVSDILKDIIKEKVTFENLKEINLILASSFASLSRHFFSIFKL